MKLLLFSLLTLFISVEAAQIRFARQALPRVNQIKIDNVSLTVDRDENCSTLWVINARCGNESRKIQMTYNGTDYLWFPNKILAVSNWNLPRGENWNCMQETLGELEIKEVLPSEVTRPVAPSAKMKGKRLIISNGNITLECVPEMNGIIPVFCDSADSHDLFIGSAAGKNSLSLKSFENVGFIDLLGGYGKTPEANMKWNDRGGIVNMSGNCAASNNILLERTIRVLPDSFAVEISSQARKTAPGAVLPELRHRPTAYIPGKFGTSSLNIMIPKKGRLTMSNVPAGSECTVDGACYAIADRDTGVMTGVEYAGARQLYLWVDKKFMTLEANGTKGNSSVTPPLRVRYFFIHGLSRADFIGNSTVIALPEHALIALAKKDLSLELVIGSAVPLKNPVLNITLSGKTGKLLKKMSVTPDLSAPGFASKMKITLPTSKINPGEISVKLDLVSQGKNIVSGTFPAYVFSAGELEKEKACLRGLDKRIQQLRKEFPKSKNRRAVMREFRRMSLFRKQFADALENGRIDELNKLKQENNK